jgi:hypothetical protein
MRQPPLNKGSDIAEYLTAVLGTIRKANGFNTDIGRLVMRGRRKIDESHIPCAVIIEGEDRPGNTNGRMVVKIDQDYVIGGYDVCDPDNPNDQAHLIVKDIKKALWRAGVHDLNLGGRVDELRYGGKDIGPRVDGEPVIFAVVHSTVTFSEKLDDA